MSRRNRGADTETISDDELAAIRRGELSRRGTCLLIYHRDGVQIAALRPDQPLVVGRAPDAPERLVVEDESLSREHARFTLKGDTVVVEDLDSLNGTWSLGERIKRADLVTGDEIRLGKVPVIVHGAQALRPAARPLRHETFRVALEDELRRATFFDRPLSLLMVRAASAAGAHVSRFHQRVSAELRPVDRMAFYGPDILEILLPEVGAEDALRWARRIAAPSNAKDPSTGLLVGVAVYPNTARNLEDLVEKCRDALTEVDPGERVRVAPGLAGRVAPARSDEQVMGAAFQVAFERIRRLAKSSLPILILGETGVGKEVLARRIHAESPRAGRPLVIVNCAAIPEALVEGTLFGYERGAFTGATQRMPGLFEAADEGTLMLDEIGDLPRQAQGALLRVLESGLVRRLGATAETPVNVRILAATHRDLGGMVAEKTFRQDLFHRLGGEKVVVPPLRERRDEIPALCESFIHRANRANARAVKRVAGDAAALLREYSWPGNVRELRNAVERAVILCESDTITTFDLPESIWAGAPEPRHEGSAAPPAPLVPAPSSDRASNGKSSEIPAPPPTLRPAIDLDAGDLRTQLTALETGLLVAALQESSDTKTAAERLGLPVRTLFHKMTTHGITRKASTWAIGPAKPRKR